MRRHANQDYESIINDMGYFAFQLSGKCWQSRMEFSLYVDGDEVDTKVNKNFKFNVFEALDADKHVAVVLIPNEFLTEFKMSSYGFTDATFQTVPTIVGASQLLTFMVEVKRKVCM